jgi:hypothetical protein
VDVLFLFPQKKKNQKENSPAGKSSFVGWCFGRAGGYRRFPMPEFRTAMKGLVL